MNIAQLFTVALIIGALAAGAWIMDTFFGIVGVILLVVFTLPMIAVVAYLSGGGESGSANRARGVESKGARSRED